MGLKAKPAGATERNLIFGAGCIYFNYGEASEAWIGATKEGGSFEVDREIVEIEQDGAYGAIKGLKHKTKIQPMLKINAMEINTTNIVKFYAGTSVSTTNPSYDVLTELTTIASGDYLTNVAFVGETLDGEDVVVIVKNALGDGKIEWAIKDKEEIVPEVQFTGHYATDALTTVPYEIRFPKSSADATAPTMTSSPTGGATGVSRSVTPVLTFNEAIKSGGVTTDNIMLYKTSDYSKVTITLALNAAQTEVTITPSTTLAASSQYLLVVGTAIENIAGVNFAGTTVAFTTTS